MIKLEHTVLPSPEQMEFVIEGMRNPMNSWDKSDSYLECENGPCDECEHQGKHFDGCSYWGGEWKVGDNDYNLMKRLSAAGTDHRKFLRMMPVMVRITAPLYWWKEFDTYKVGTVANSCSTMHKITEKKFTLDDFSCEHLLDYRFGWSSHEPTNLLKITINELNSWRSEWLRINEQLKSSGNEELRKKQKDIWWQMIQLLPSSYNQTRNVMLNYEVLSNIYIPRSIHKLDEWREFCKWIETLPYSDLITGGNI